VLLAGCGGEARAIPYTDLTRETGPLEFTRITRQLFRSGSELRDVLERNNPGRRLHLPAIDFTRQEAYLVAAGPRSSTGYELRVLGVRDEGGRRVVTVRERTPALGDPVHARVTYPFRLLALPRSDKPVKLQWLGRP
jgi:protease stability complex PrcB-like protein